VEPVSMGVALETHTTAGLEPGATSGVAY